MKTLKTIALAFFVMLTISSAFAQNDLAYNTNNSQVALTEENAEFLSMRAEAPAFVGGNEALTDYMFKNMIYPERAKKKGIEGTVMLQYTIGQNGEIKDVKVVQSVSTELDQEAVRLAENMPEWTPAKQNGQAKAIKYQLPVTFELNF